MSTPPTFVYRGKDLVGPLESMIRSLLIELARAAAEYKAMPPSSKELPKQTDIGRPDTPALKLQRRIAQLRQEGREASIWLLECKRTPRAKWVLSLEQVCAIYRDIE